MKYIALAFALCCTPAVAKHHTCSQTFVGTDADDTIDQSANPCNVKLKGLRGNDTLIGGSGNNTLIGAAGADELTGGCCGNNVFQYNVLSDSSELGEGLLDTVFDFDTSRDKLDFSRICATISGGCSLASAFTNVPGQIVYHYLEEWRCDPNCHDTYVTIVEMDSNGVGWPDFGVWLANGKLVLTTDNFIL